MGVYQTVLQKRNGGDGSGDGRATYSLEVGLWHKVAGAFLCFSSALCFNVCVYIDPVQISLSRPRMVLTTSCCLLDRSTDLK